MSNVIRFLVGISLAAAMTGCHAFDREYLDPKVASHVVVSRGEPPPACELVGFIKGSTFAGDLGDAHGEVLRSAVLRGGNYVTVDLVERPMIVGMGGYTVRARLFNCPASGQAPMAGTLPVPAAPARVPAAFTPGPAAAPAAADPTTVKACEPDCATGFMCQLGVCVSALPAQAGR